MSLRILAVRPTRHASGAGTTKRQSWLCKTFAELVGPSRCLSGTFPPPLAGDSSSQVPQFVQRSQQPVSATLEIIRLPWSGTASHGMLHEFGDRGEASRRLKRFDFIIEAPPPLEVAGLSASQTQQASNAKIASTRADTGHLLARQVTRPSGPVRTATRPSPSCGSTTARCSVICRAHCHFHDNRVVCSNSGLASARELLRVHIFTMY